LAESHAIEKELSNSPFGLDGLRAFNSQGTSHPSSVREATKLGYDLYNYDPFKATELKFTENDSAFQGSIQNGEIDLNCLKGNSEIVYDYNGQKSDENTHLATLISKYQLDALIKMSAYRLQTGERNSQSIYSTEDSLLYTNSLQLLVADLESSNHLNKASNYGLDGLYVFGSSEPESVQSLLLFQLFGFAEKVFASDLQSYFEIEQFLVTLIERNVDLGLEALVIAYEISTANIKNQKSFIEVIFRVIQSMRNSGDLALRLYKWIFCRAEFGTQFEIAAFFLNSFRTFKDREPLTVLQKNWILSLDNFILTRTINESNNLDAWTEAMAIDFNEIMHVGEKAVNTLIMINFMNFAIALIISGKRPSLEKLKSVVAFVDRCNCDDPGLEKEVRTFLYLVIQIADEVGS